MTSSETTVLSKDCVNTGRQPELDLLKAIAVIVMLFEHSYLYLLDGGSQFEGFSVADYISQITNASVFMMCMGMSIHYARHSSPKAFLIRGAAVLTVGQLLALLRDVLPYYIGYAVSGNRYFFCTMALVFNDDIMQLAGLSFLLIALFKKLKLRPLQVFLISCGLNLLGSLLADVNTGSYFVNQLLGTVWLTEAESFFPLLSWFIYIAFGYWFGDVYRHISDKDRFFRPLFLILVPLCTVYFGLRIATDIFPFYDIVELEFLICPALPDALMTVGVDVVLIGFLYKVSKLFHGRMPAFITYPAKHINKYYCVSYVIINSLAVALLLVRGKLIENMTVGVLVCIAIIAACTIIIVFYERRLEVYVKRLSAKQAAAAGAAIWIISFAVAAYVFPRAEAYPNWRNDYLASEEYHYFE